MVSVKIGYSSCVYASTMNRVGVMVSYECGVMTTPFEIVRVYLVAMNAAEWYEFQVEALILREII